MALDHKQIAVALLGYPIDEDGCAPCPGEHLHTTPSGRDHWRIWFDPSGEKMPSEHCFHSNCQAARDEFMTRLYRAIRAAEKNGSLPPQSRPAWKPAPTAPGAAAKRRPEKPVFDKETAYRVAAACPLLVDAAHLRAISPVEIPEDPGTWAELLIDTLYRPDERILCFTNMQSQGQFLRVVRGRNYRLSHRPGERATPCPHLPTRGENGCWFLCSPVVGSWKPNPQKLNPETRQPMPGRRHAACCTRFPYAVLESDNLSPLVWFAILSTLHDPIAAIYTSGGKSIHALISLGDDCTTTEQFNAKRADLMRRLVPVGADPAAITPVRLTRLPGAERLSKLDPATGRPMLQELLYLNPNPAAHQPLYTLPQLRALLPQT